VARPCVLAGAALGTRPITELVAVTPRVFFLVFCLNVLPEDRVRNLQEFPLVRVRPLLLHLHIAASNAREAI
jgi:hypothetical protein